MVYYRRSPYLFTYWNEDDKIVLYNYNRYTRALVSKEVLKILNTLSEWRNAHELSDKLDIDKRSLTKALEHLSKLKMVLKNNISNEDTHIRPRAPWDPIDLAMQRQRSYGGSLPMSERVGKRVGMSPSPIKHVKGLSSILLSIPGNIRQNKTALLDVLEARKSIRKYANSYISKDNLSHFLYYSARIKEIFKNEEGTLTKRPYPSGGARYPLEIYVVNNRMSSIEKGIHYYDPLKHQLILINKNKTYQNKFNTFVMNALHPHMKRDSDVVFIITAVFARTMWKYEKIAMSLILSDLGCLYQTMYLVATEMNLAPCPLGKPAEELVKDWLNLSWFEESHVGTFLLGKPESG
jgi:SagB-type dehydrogenase family enzyme